MKEKIVIDFETLEKVLTKYGLGGSEIVLRNIWLMLQGKPCE